MRMKINNKLDLLNECRILLTDPDTNTNKINDWVQLALVLRELDTVKLLLEDPRVDPTLNDSKILLIAADLGYTEIVTLLLTKHQVDPAAQNNAAIKSAASQGHTGVLALLLADKRVNPAAENNVSIQLASENGHTNIVALLLADKRAKPDVDGFIACNVFNGRIDTVVNTFLAQCLINKQVNPAENNSAALRKACSNNHRDIVKLLLVDKRVNPAVENNLVLKWASKNGFIDIVELLLDAPQVDPASDKNMPIQLASENGHREIVKLLLSCSRVKKFMSEIKNKNTLCNIISVDLFPLLSPILQFIMPKERDLTENINNSIFSFFPTDITKYILELNVQEKIDEFGQTLEYLKP